MKFTTPQFYTLFTGIVLFLFGFLGFAFNSIFNVADSYLFFSLVLGFWGIVVGINSRTKK
jgi:lipoprotein signal peptidase